MFEPGFNLWNNIPVWAIDYRLESGDVQAGMMSTVATHCVACVYIDEATYGALKGYLETTEHRAHRNLADTMKVGQEIIMLALPEFEHLSLKQQEAIMYHELHHIDRGDNLRSTETDKRGLLQDIDAEKACDAYAAAQTGCDSYIKAGLKALLKRSAIMHSRLTGADVKSVYEDMLADVAIACRL